MKEVSRAIILLTALSLCSAACGSACGGARHGVESYIPEEASVSGIFYMQPGDELAMQGETPESSTPSQRMYAMLFEHVDMSQFGASMEALRDFKPMDMGFFLDDSMLVYIGQTDEAEALAQATYESMRDSEDSALAEGFVVEESKVLDDDGITTYAYRASVGSDGAASTSYSYAMSAHEKHLVAAVGFSMPGTAESGDADELDAVIERSRRLERVDSPLAESAHFRRATTSLPAGLEARMVLSFNLAKLAGLAEDAAPRDLSDSCQEANEELLRRVESSVVVFSESSDRSALQWRLGLDEEMAENFEDVMAAGFDAGSVVGAQFPLAGALSFGSLASLVLDEEASQELTETSRCMNLAGVLASQTLAVSGYFEGDDSANQGDVRVLAAMPPVSLLRNGGVPELLVRVAVTEEDDMTDMLEGRQAGRSGQTAAVVEIDGEEVHIVENANAPFGGYEASATNEYWNGTFEFGADEVEHLAAASEDGPPIQIAWSPSSMRSLLTAAEMSVKATVRFGSLSIPDGGPIDTAGVNALISAFFATLKETERISFSVDIDDRDVVIELR